jgi:hypothetical protein
VHLDTGAGTTPGPRHVGDQPGTEPRDTGQERHEATGECRDPGQDQHDADRPAQGLDGGFEHRPTVVAGLVPGHPDGDAGDQHPGDADGDQSGTA